MQGTLPASRIRFGPFEFDALSTELRRHGLRIRLQGKPLQILQALLESPGTVVTRDELQRRLWPADTFVDFENGLNTAIKRLRTALNDSADNPRYVETVARSGYRFVAPIEVLEDRTAPQRVAPAPAKRHWWPIAAMAAAIALAVGSAMWNRNPPAADFRIQPVTFRRGTISGARFGPDGQTILYTARWDAGLKQLYLHSGVSPESRPLGLADWNLLSVSSRGELLLAQAPGTLPIGGADIAKVPMNGGVPIVIERNAMSADWSPDGTSIALARAVAGAFALEYPAGKVLHRTSGWISSVRVSPEGDAVAFVEHPIRHDDGGTLRLLTVSPGGGSASKPRDLAGPWPNIGGVEWHAGTGEIWFTAADSASPKSLRAVTRGGRLRSVAQMAGPITLADISASGRVLITRDTRRLEVAGRLASDSAERDYSWLDWSRAQDIAADGARVLFDESGDAVKNGIVSYVRSREDDSVVRLGDAAAMGFTPDGTGALLLAASDRSRFRLAPLGGGPWRELPAFGLTYQWGKFFPDGRSVLALASENGGPLRLYRHGLTGDTRPEPIAPPGTVRHTAISPDGRTVAALMPDGRLTLFPADPGGSEPRVIPTAEPVGPIRFSPDGRQLFVQHQRDYTEVPTRVSRIEVATGAIREWRRVGPRDPVGVNMITRVLVAPGEDRYLFTYRRVLSELFSLEPR